MPHQLSIVIPVHGNWWLTQRCLRELERLRISTHVSFEVIVVDNASADETPIEIAAFPGVRYERFEQNRNFAGACNAGVRLADAPVVLLLNNDAYPIGDAMTPLVRAFERDEVAIAGGALFYEDGVTQSAGLVLLRNAHWHHACRSLPEAFAGGTTPRDALAVSGAAMAVRAEWFIRSGGFDDAFVNGFEDVDLCLRARTQGRRIVFVPTARFIHYEGATAGRFDREAENERRFYRAWSSRLAALPRTGRGNVGAIVVRRPAVDDPLRAAALEDLEGALRAFGHPVVHGPISAWQRFDRRFRNAAVIGWFTDVAEGPGVTVERSEGSPMLHTHGEADVIVPWLPCAADERVASIGIALQTSESVPRIAVAGSDADVGALALGEIDVEIVRVTPELLLSARDHLGCNGVIHAGLTDDSAFGNVVLARAGIPAIVLDRAELRALFSTDVASFTDAAGLRERVEELVADPEAQARLGRLVAADAKRRFAPRRSAIRIVDLLCTARCGFEAPASALGNAPVSTR